jgi:hypothetical protein
MLLSLISTFLYQHVYRTSRLLKNCFSCFESLSTNGKCPMISIAPPFALRFSKGERRVFQQPARRKAAAAIRPEIKMS